MMSFFFAGISTADFSAAQSYVQFRPQISAFSMEIKEISFKFRTLVKNGHIFSITNGNNGHNITFKMIGGKMTAKCYLGNTNQNNTAVVDLHVADKRWHTVTLKEYTNNLTLMVVSSFENKSDAILKESTAMMLNLLVLAQGTEFVLGYDGRNSMYFKGCVREPRIGGILLPFYSQSSFTNFTTAEYFEAVNIQGISHNCIQGQQCGQDQCRHGSACQPDYYGYTCNCRETGYEGFWCQNNIDNCAEDPCSNSGVCVDKVNAYSCKCHKPYYGNV